MRHQGSGTVASHASAGLGWSTRESARPREPHDGVGAGDVSKWDSPPFGTTERDSPQPAGLSGEADRGPEPRSGYVQASWLVPADESSLASLLWFLL